MFKKNTFMAEGIARVSVNSLLFCSYKINTSTHDLSIFLYIDLSISISLSLSLSHSLSIPLSFHLSLAFSL